MRRPVRNLTQIKGLTSGLAHFFGYYDKCPWSRDGRRMLVARASFQDRPPTASDRLALGTIDVRDGRFEAFADTAAWSWQQGTMLQWIGDSDAVLYNGRADDDRAVGVVHDLRTGRTRALPRAVYALHPDGSQAIGLDFGRLQALRPGYGYPPATRIHADNAAPANDGLWRIDTHTGATSLIVSIADVAAHGDPPPGPGMAHWFNHATYNTDGSRLCFLHRYRPIDGTGGWRTRLFTVDANGDDLRLLNGRGLVSHFAWRDPDHLLAWCIGRDGGEAGYFLLSDKTDEARPVGAGVLTRDGHMTYSPDGRWLVTDEYPSGDPPAQPLLLFELATGRRVEIGRFAAPLAGELRCDLHPRWNRDGTQICFDSAHTGTRQVYVADVSAIVGAEATA